MTDPLDDRLASAGRVLIDDTEVSSALLALSEACAAEAPTTRRRRLLLPSIIIGSLLGVSGAGAVVATQWLPWEMAEPDLVVAREWTNVSGTYLGTCETRVAAASVSAEFLAQGRNYLSTVDVDSIKPDAGIVAMSLRAVGRPDDIGRLIPGAHAADFPGEHEGKLWDVDWFSDARILQDGLTWALFDEMVADFAARGLDGDIVGVNELGAHMETQCTTDPTRTADQ